MSIVKETEWVVSYARTVDGECTQDTPDGDVTVLAKTPEAALVLGRKVISKVVRRVRRASDGPASFFVTAVTCGGDVYHD